MRKSFAEFIAKKSCPCVVGAAASAHVAGPEATKPNERWRTILCLIALEPPAASAFSRSMMIAAVKIYAWKLTPAYQAERVVRELEALVRIYGKPENIVSDNGTEFTSKAVLKWGLERFTQ